MDFMLATEAGSSMTAAQPAVEKAISDVVAQLNALCKAATFEFAIAVGRVVIDGFYGGDLDAWRARGPKTVSFRKLSKHADLPMSPAALYRSVAIFEISSRLGLSTRGHISTSHIRLVLPLLGDHQVRLLRLAERNLWSVRELRAQVGLLGSEPSTRHIERGGRKRASAARRALCTLQCCIETLGDLTTAADHEMRASRDAAQAVLELATRVRAACSALESCALAHLSNERCEADQGPDG